MVATLAKTYSNYSHDWWTPPEWIEWVTATFGTSDWFDPCPTDWQPEDVSGLEGDWDWHNYINHPGSRGSTSQWWEAAMDAHGAGASIIWCAFSVEQLRHMDPSPLELPGWLVLPRQRIGFIWGGPDKPGRKHGEVAKSPGNWTVFWSSVEPAPTPIPSVIVPTGVQL